MVFVCAAKMKDSLTSELQDQTSELAVKEAQILRLKSKLDTHDALYEVSAHDMAIR